MQGRWRSFAGGNLSTTPDAPPSLMRQQLATHFVLPLSSGLCSWRLCSWGLDWLLIVGDLQGGRANLDESGCVKDGRADGCS